MLLPVPEHLPPRYLECQHGRGSSGSPRLRVFAQRLKLKEDFCEESLGLPRKHVAATMLVEADDDATTFWQACRRPQSLQSTFRLSVENLSRPKAALAAQQGRSVSMNDKAISGVAFDKKGPIRIDN
ncbi:hypothetical protein HIM_12403 [Hirsutella minnesotensis 3608]|uniref:Uncharacterized protein n=1 Tax=Hirsutella minnesotensis 3608 TaxID=1043627 RepID=A0A0F7ZQP2_9HYPO|nr:hypothetical protein HIM_12403 [Hirsutella minnesotensis 3608]